MMSDMSPLLMVLLACVGCIAIVVRGGLGRFEQLGVVLFVVVVACVGCGGLLSSSFAPSDLADGRALIACIMGPLLALAWRSELTSSRAGGVAAVVAACLLVTGLLSHAAALVSSPVAPIAVGGSLILAIATAVVATAGSWRVARSVPSTLWRARITLEALAVAFVGSAALLAGVGVVTSTSLDASWPAVCGLGAALATSARASAVPLMTRDLGLVTGAAAWAALISQNVATAAAVATGVVVTHGLLGPLVLPQRRAASSTPSGSPGVAAPAAVPAGLFGLIPIGDEGATKAPTRLRVQVRTPARRLIDVAVDRAWRGVSPTRARPSVEVVGGDEVDVDGDPGELAESLSAVFSSALRAREPHDPRLCILVRSAPTTLSIEVEETGLVMSAAPVFEVDDDGVPTTAVSLARAKGLIERSGGTFHVRGRGALHLTLPRRPMRPPMGLA
jgi:hypothetical protein